MQRHARARAGEIAMRKDIEFGAEGVTLRGWLYVPDGARKPAPTVVMAHGFSGVKEDFLDRFAEVFCAAGVVAVAYDHRNFGASDGEPRQEIDPWQQIRDYRHAITWARMQPEVDRERIGIWGTSYTGSHVLVVAALDRRVKCVVSQVPVMSGSVNVGRMVRSDLIPAMRAQFDADREARFLGKPPGMIAVASPDPNVPCALPTPDCWDWFVETQKRAPAWRNEVTLRSLEMLTEYEPGDYIARISPTPLLLIVAAHDRLAVADATLAAFNRALEPKKLVLIDGGHFDPYVNHFSRSSSAARDWLLEHLTR